MTPTTALGIITIILFIWNLWLTFLIKVLHHYQNGMEQELKASIALTDAAISVVVGDNYDSFEDFEKKFDKHIEQLQKN